MARPLVGGAANMKPEGEQADLRPVGFEGNGGNSEVTGDDRGHRDRPPQKVAQVIHMRRQMQRERKEMLAELRPTSAVDRPGTASGSFLWHKESRHSEVDDEEAEEETVSRPAPKPRATTQSVLAKVNRAHKGLVRREVWRQKFDFLYKLVEAEMREDKNNQAHSSTANVGGNSANAASTSASMSILPGRDKLSSGMFARYAAAMQFPEHLPLPNSHVPSRPSSASHSSVGKTIPRSRSASLCSRACTAPAGSQAGSRGGISSNNNCNAFDCDNRGGDECRQNWRACSPSSHSIRGGWCSTRSSRPRNSHRSKRGPPTCNSRSGASISKTLCSETLPRLLSGSASLPLLSYKAPQSQSIWSGSASLHGDRKMEEQVPIDGKSNLCEVVVKFKSGVSIDSLGKTELVIYAADKKQTKFRAAAAQLDLQPTSGKGVSFYDDQTQYWALQFSTREEANSLTTILQEAKVSEQLGRELCGIRDEYYKGNDCFMHEDILHCSNPDLFPLCTNPEVFPLRPFPLGATDDIHGDDVRIVEMCS